MLVDVCVCTFRRPELAHTLASLAGQVLPPGLRLRVIVADNDATPSARGLVAEACARLGLEALYVHAPFRNISVARNACLDAATAELIAFIDDDEIACHDWLARLAGHLEATGADAAFGPVRACYGDAGPAWLRAADLHATAPVVRPGRGVTTGYTCNAILRRTGLGEHRFDPALGQTGGEDTLFFAALHRAGARLEVCPDALVVETVPAARAGMGWLLRRSFRSGQTHGRLLEWQGAGRLRPALLAAAKAGTCFAAALARAGSAAGWRRWLVRGVRHCGVAGYLLGKAELRIYGGA